MVVYYLRIMEQQVIHAALATVQAHTSVETRLAASNFLEQWTRSDVSCQCYLNLIQLCFGGDGTIEQWIVESSLSSSSASSNDSMGIKLLLLTMLRSKCQNISLDSDGSVYFVTHIKRLLYQTLQDTSSSIVPLIIIDRTCSSLAALIVRSHPP